MATPLDMPARPRTIVLPVRVAWTTSTGDLPLGPRIPAHDLSYADGGSICPGSNGEISSGACRSIYGDRCFCW